MSGFGQRLDAFTTLAPGVRRMLAPNPSMMTGPGTNTYLLGEAAVAVVDPGPAIAAHIDNIVASAGAPVHWILATHTHPDHSPGVRYLAELTGAEVLGMAAPDTDHQDTTFRPTRELADGDRLRTTEFELQAVHTPGHASNHLCYQLLDRNWVLTGDHIIAGSTVVINPPDGNMRDYLESLARIKALRPLALLPGHGDRIDDSEGLIDWIVAHRLEREARVLAAVRAQGGQSSAGLVPHAYSDVPESLYGWAERSLLAHLIKLEADGLISESSGAWAVID